MWFYGRHCFILLLAYSNALFESIFCYHLVPKWCDFCVWWLCRIWIIWCYSNMPCFCASFMTLMQIWVPSNPRGAERLPPGIVRAESDLYLRRLWGKPSEVCLLGPLLYTTYFEPWNSFNFIMHVWICLALVCEDKLLRFQSNKFYKWKITFAIVGNISFYKSFLFQVIC